MTPIADSANLSIANVLEGLPLPDSCMDFGILAEVIEHLPTPEKALSEMARVMRQDAPLFVTTVKDENQMDHITNFPSVDYVKNMISESGFDIQKEIVYCMTDDFPEGNDKAVGMAFVCKRR
jgi:ubiquinone/menaquinone biosynthesis C-methylase UbiE